MLLGLVVDFGYGLAIVFGALLAGAYVRYFYLKRAGKTTLLPVKFNLNEVRNVIQAALAGNTPMLKDALDKSLETEWQAGDRIHLLLQQAMKEARRRVDDPAVPAPVIERISFWTGLTEQEVLAILEKDFNTPAPATVIPNVAKALALVAFLLIPSVAAADHINYDVKGPQRFYATDTTPIVDAPSTWDQAGHLRPYHEVSYVRYAAGDSLPVYGPGESRGFAPVRNTGRFMGRVGRGAVRVISAPFRFLFRRGC